MSASLTRSISFSSRSRNDMWQPEQPHSHTVAMRFLPVPLLLSLITHLR